MIYLDNAATTFPKPISVTESVAECMAEWCANPGRAGHRMAMKSGEEVYRTRNEIAGLIGCQADEIVFTQNCTGALNLALHGILKPGDHVITTMMEHNSVLRPLNELRMRGVETSIVRCSSEGFPLEGAIEAAIRDNTRMIVCTMASNVTGTVMPVGEIGKIARQRGILFFVDGSQGIGVLDIDVKDDNVDILATSGHKSLMGPQGTGFSYVRQGIPVHPIIQGGTGSESRNISQPLSFPEGFEAGTVNVPGIAGLGEGIRFIKEVGIAEIRKKEEKLIDCLEMQTKKINGLIRYGPKNPQNKVGIFSFNIEGIDCERTAALLDRKYGIAVRAGLHCAPLAHQAIGTGKTGCVRMSVSLFNTEQDMTAAAEAIRKIASEDRE